MSSRGRDLLKLSAIIGVAFAFGLAFASALNLPRPGEAQQRTAATLPSSAPIRRSADGAVPSFADIVDRVNPAVVYVQTDRRQRAQARPRGLPPEFDDFFRRFQIPEPRLREGSGSGFIVSQDGYILTNNHVVAEADTIKVKLLDNREFGARLVGRDPNTDVAVIKINASHLPAATLGNSEGTRVGDWVLAVGNPLGFTFTVTAGIVSAKGRALPGLVDQGQQQQSYTIQDFIQTDAAINPGNSGGPLVNLQGEVIGINSAIASQTGYYSGYGFAIPINLARRVMDDLIRSGRVTRAILGVNIGEISPEDAEFVGLRDIKGVVVRAFPEGSRSPARSAGIREGDVIVALNDTSVDHVAQLQQMVGFRHPGDVVRVTVVRREGAQRDVRRTLDVRLASAEDNDQVASSDSGSAGRASERPAAAEGRLGIQIVSLTSDIISQARLSADQRGVLVSDVEAGGPSWGKVKGPDQGGPELILSVNETRVRTPDEFQAALRGVARGEVVSLRVLNLNAQSGQTRIVRIRTRP